MSVNLSLSYKGSTTTYIGMGSSEWEIGTVDVKLNGASHEVSAHIPSSSATEKRQPLKFETRKIDSPFSRSESSNTISLPIDLAKTMKLSVGIFQTYKNPYVRTRTFEGNYECETRCRRDDLGVSWDSIPDFKENENYEIKIVNKGDESGGFPKLKAKFKKLETTETAPSNEASSNFLEGFMGYVLEKALRERSETAKTESTSFSPEIPLSEEEEKLKDAAFKERLKTCIEESKFKYSEEQLRWLRIQFELFESPSSKTSPLQDYLNAASRFPAVPLENNTIGYFRFIYQANTVAVNIPLEVLKEQGIEVEQFVEILSHFISSSEKSFVMSERLGSTYPLNKLELYYVQTKEGTELQFQFKINSALAMQSMFKNMFV